MALALTSIRPHTPDLRQRLHAGRRPWLLLVVADLKDGAQPALVARFSRCAVFHPMEDPDFGDSFECAKSLWTGLYGFRYWRAFIQLPDHSLTLGEIFVSLECYNTVEATVHGFTNWALVAFRHKPPTTPWRLAGPLRNVATTVP